MPLTIWKTVLKPADVQDLIVPEGAELLTARDLYGELCVWFKCDPNRPPTTRQVAIVGTGHQAPEDGRYLGTGFIHGGALVFHIFERVASDVKGSSNG